MCTIFMAYKTVPGYPLLIAANRDEFFDRPAQPMAYWEDSPHVLGGRDLRAKGTWLGVNKHGRIALITNFRDPSKTDQSFKTRGLWPARFLRNNPDPKKFGEKLLAEGDQYRGFNLVFGSAEALYYFSNKSQKLAELKPGLYGLSNHYLDTPWPKIRFGKAQMKQWGSDTSQWASEKLFQLLGNRDQATDDALPDTGVGLGWERLLSSIFIETINYGTRNSTVLRFHEDQTIQAEDWSWNKAAETPFKQHFQFTALT